MLLLKELNKPDLIIMSITHRSPLDSSSGGTKMVQTYKIAVLGDGGVGKSGEGESEGEGEGERVRVGRWR